MDEFVHRIVKCLTTEAMRLSVVKNPDGFLCAADTQQKVLDESGLLYDMNSKINIQRIMYAIL